MLINHSTETVTSQTKWRFVLSSIEKVSWRVLCLDFSCVANCYLHKGKKEECASNLVYLIIAQPKILKSGPCSLEALYCVQLRTVWLMLAYD